jgi:hypothetical protein
VLSSNLLAEEIHSACSATNGKFLPVTKENFLRGDTSYNSMNKKGEMEISINKRLVERAVFLFIIIALAVLLFIEKQEPSTETPDLTANLTALTQLNQQQQEQIQELQAELEDKNEEAKQPAPVVVTNPEPTLSNKVVFDWNVKGQKQTPIQYNAGKIAALQEDLDELQEKYDDTESESLQDDLEDRMDLIRAEIRDLSVGDSKYKLEEVSITVDNGRPLDFSYEYSLCWSTLNCNNLKSEGIINVASGEVYTEIIDLKIPTTVSLDKLQQTLRLTISQDGKEVFQDDFTVK